MKCATTSLHNVLSGHPDVFIPEREIGCLDMDDQEQHPDFFIYSGRRWTYPDWENERDKYLQWYASFFQNAKPGQLIGEDSTTYIASAKTAGRMAQLLPDVKLIFMLRDPANRTYSHYWHLVRTGRARHRFEDMLQYEAGTLLQRSLYKEQLERYFRLFPRERIKIILFEDFTKDLPGVVNDVLEFLELPKTLDTKVLRTHWNRGQIPLSPRLQLLRNRLIRGRAGRMYYDHLPMNVTRPWHSQIGDKAQYAVHLAFRLANPMRENSPPPMRPETRAFLNDLFRKANAGLSELIGIDVEQKWQPGLRSQPFDLQEQGRPT
jgi:hypothetical protein